MSRLQPLSVNIIYNKTNTYGLNDDIIVIERLLKKLQESIGQTIGKPKVMDMREIHSACDIQFHLEIPVFSAIPWGHTNVLLVNPEQWSYHYDAYVHAFDMLLFRDHLSAERFRKELGEKGLSTENIYEVKWCDSWKIKDLVYRPKDLHSGFVCFLGGSKSKLEYVKKVVAEWKDNDPPLTLYTTRNDFLEDLKKLNASSNVRFLCQDLSTDLQMRTLSSFCGSLVCSQAEAFGYAASHSESMGLFTIMNQLPVFLENYSNCNGVAWLSNSYQSSPNVRQDLAQPTSSLRQELDHAFQLFHSSDPSLFSSRQSSSSQRFSQSLSTFLPLLQQLQSLVHQRKPKGIHHLPPILDPNDCPPITVITPTYNRKQLFDIAFHNILSTDYPLSKIEWIIIEDNEKTPHMVSEKIINFQIQVPQIKIKYIPIEGRMSIGEKRNYAIKEASNEIILFMDDDDHYPTTSFRRRVAWLTKGIKRGQVSSRIACCTTIALYDLNRGTSAVNVPPFDIAFSQRISEATFTFYKSAWLERPFTHISLSEGEDWIQGRENQVIEIPPQQIIVAFSHGSNQSQRRIPPLDQPPSCFWGFPKEYLIFVHNLVGVQIEEQSSKKKSTKSKS